MISKIIENIFESGMWKVRLFVLLPVIFGLVGAIILFIVASKDIYEVLVYTVNVYSNGLHPENFHEEIVSKIIGAVDLYLIAVVMLIFGISTIPALFFLGFFIGLFKQSNLRDTFIRIASILVIIFGIYIAYQGYEYIVDPTKSILNCHI